MNWKKLCECLSIHAGVFLEIFRANGSHAKMLSDEAENREADPEAFV